MPICTNRSHGSLSTLTATATLGLLVLSANAQDAVEDDARRAIAPLPHAGISHQIEATFTPLHDLKKNAQRRDTYGPPGCPQEVQTFADTDFDGSVVTVALPPGMVETEIAATTYTVDADSWPILINTADIVWAQNHFNATESQWTYMVWEGEPHTGTLVASFSSDDTILPHINLPVGGANAVLLSVSVDPGDPEQIIVTNNGSNKFTIGFRIDAHNNPPASSCTCLGGIGTLPAVCCPPDTNSNAWPAMDTSGPDAAAENWIFARDCPGGFSLCFEGPSWLNFTSIPAQFVNDWAIRVKYTPLNCPTFMGACCLPEGSCEDDVETVACESMGGTFQGDSTLCLAITCPDPVGACCISSGGSTTCLSDEEEMDCLDQGGYWYGPGTECNGPACPSGACCFDPTGCANLNPINCATAGGTFGGIDTDCATYICNPTGACCMPDGSCVDDSTPEDCDAVGGTFRGDGTECASEDCPAPLGACCLNGGACILETQENCENIPGATWAGAGITCESAKCDPMGACCLSGGGCFLETEGNCTAIPGASWAGQGTTCESGCTPDCPEDIDGNGEVSTTDLLALLAGWGPCPGGCDEDVTGDENVDTQDLLAVLAAWGACE